MSVGIMKNQSIGQSLVIGRFVAQKAGTTFTLTLGSDRAAAEMAVMGRGVRSSRRSSWTDRGHCCWRHRPAARAFECRVDDYESGRYGLPPGDHDEGQFEGQNGAGECLSELAPACVS
jgi:hypothetical protein